MNRDIERAIIQQIKNGNYHSYEKFIIEYQNRLFGFIFSLVKNRDDAIDLCQETFFKAYKSIRSFKGQSKFSTWLFQIGYFQALNFLKRQKKRRDILKIVPQGSIKDHMGSEHESKELVGKIDVLLQEIPFNYRTAMHLFYKEEKSYGEIAAIMKIPLNSVKSHLFRGKEEIRKKLKKDWHINYLTNI